MLDIIYIVIYIIIVIIIIINITIIIINILYHYIVTKYICYIHTYIYICMIQPNYMCHGPWQILSCIAVGLLRAQFSIDAMTIS